MKQAHAKVERIAKKATRPYRGGPRGVRVQWQYVGITEVLPIYEELGDGAEIAWTKYRPRTLETMQSWVLQKKWKGRTAPWHRVAAWREKLPSSAERADLRRSPPSETRRHKR